MVGGNKVMFTPRDMVHAITKGLGYTCNIVAKHGVDLLQGP